LDVGPVDMLHGLSKSFYKGWDDKFIDPKLKEQAIDFTFHWVNEKGTPAKLTGGITLLPTVCTPLSFALAHTQQRSIFF